VVFFSNFLANINLVFFLCVFILYAKTHLLMKEANQAMTEIHKENKQSSDQEREVAKTKSKIIEKTTTRRNGRVSCY